MSTTAATKSSGRLESLDAYRGFVMLAMASAGFGFAQVAAKLPESRFWQLLGYQFGHVPWTGCAFWDLIQPSFMFMVGVSMPYSYGRRQEEGESFWTMFAHVLVRSIVLILLGVFLSSNNSPQTNFTFVNVLTQIGLGYVFLFLFLGRGPILQIAGSALILVGYWHYFFQHPLPPPDFDFASLGVPKNVPIFAGLFAHWNMNTNAAAHFDGWLLNLFPRPESFKFNSGGYQTLNFIPSIPTMILGLMAGELLRAKLDPMAKLRRLALAGGICMLLGLIANMTLCPSVKRIWTPSWTLISGAWTLWMLAAFYWIIDLNGYRRWAFPLTVVGVNSIAMYIMAQLLPPWIAKTLDIHLGWIIHRLYGSGLQPIADGIYMPIVQKSAVLAVLWFFCFWLYRQKIFVRI